LFCGIQRIFQTEFQLRHELGVLLTRLLEFGNRAVVPDSLLVNLLDLLFQSFDVVQCQPSVRFELHDIRLGILQFAVALLQLGRLSGEFVLEIF